MPIFMRFVFTRFYTKASCGYIFKERIEMLPDTTSNNLRKPCHQN